MKLGNLFNLKYITKPNVSLTKALLVFYVIFASQFTRGLYSGQLTDFLSSNRNAQHLVGLLLMLVIIMDFGGVKDPAVAIGYSLLAYVWFIMTTKMDLQWSMMILGLLIVGFLYESQLEDKEICVDMDDAVTDEDKKKIKKCHKRDKTYIGVAILVVTVIGTAIYLMKKREQYGGNFDIDKFVLQGRNRKY